MNAARQVIRAAKARATALVEGDAERLSALLHKDFRWTAHVGETYSRVEYIRRNTEGQTVWRSQNMRSPEVVVVGETAVLYAEVIDVVVSEGNDSETFRMPMTQVWVRFGDDWKCLSGHAGTTSDLSFADAAIRAPPEVRHSAAIDTRTIRPLSRSVGSSRRTTERSLNMRRG